jgi:hypothetical protein
MTRSWVMQALRSGLIGEANEPLADRCRVLSLSLVAFEPWGRNADLLVHELGLKGPDTHGALLGISLCF